MNDEFFMELLDREREHGRMLHQEETLNELISRRICEALDQDEEHDFYHHYEDLGKVTVNVDDLALVTGYVIPTWLMNKAERIKKEREGKE